jgi:hypothetical protein
VAVRETRGQHLVAMLEIVSLGSKDRPNSVKELADRITWALRKGIFVLLVDLLPPGRHDPQGIHGAVWEGYGPDPDESPVPGKPCTLASHLAGALAQAFVETVGLGDDLRDMPLFLEVNFYVDVPLEPTYRAAHRGVPAHIREILDGLREPQ